MVPDVPDVHYARSGGVAVADRRAGAGDRPRSACRDPHGRVPAVGEKLAGMAVHVGARVMAAAGAGEVLVSSTGYLVAGSDFSFADRGERELKGVPEPVRLYAVVP